MKQSAGWLCALTGVALLATSGCARVRADGVLGVPVGSGVQDDRRPDELEELKERTRASVPESPTLAQPVSAEAANIRDAAVAAGGLRIVISTEDRALWLLRDTAVVLAAPVAVGMDEGFTYGGRAYEFETPLGRRRVLAKDTMPIWVPPDWHYFELAVKRDLEAVHLKPGQRVALSDSTIIAVQGDEVGRINRFGNFWPFTPGTEIIFDDKVFIPPFGSRQRKVPEILGTHKLELGDGYLIHGTNQATSIGDAVSHGCVRMYNEDVARLYSLVPVGTSVYIY